MNFPGQQQPISTFEGPKAFTGKKTNVLTLLEKARKANKWLYVKPEGKHSYLKLGSRAPGYAKSVNEELRKRGINDRFVYLSNPPISGPITNIYQLLRDAGLTYLNITGPNGLQVQVPLSIDTIAQYSWDFSSPEREREFKAILVSQGLSPKTGGKKKEPKAQLYSFEDNSAIIRSFKGSRGKLVRKGGKTKIKDINELIVKADNVLDAVFSGRMYTVNGNDKALNVSDYDPNSNTGVRPVKYTSEDKGLVYPELVIDGTKRRIPIVVNPHSLTNYQQFITNVVGKTKYNNYVNILLDAGRVAVISHQNKPGNSPLTFNVTNFNQFTRQGQNSPPVSPSRILPLGSSSQSTLYSLSQPNLPQPVYPQPIQPSGFPPQLPSFPNASPIIASGFPNTFPVISNGFPNASPVVSSISPLGSVPSSPINSALSPATNVITSPNTGLRSLNTGLRSPSLNFVAGLPLPSSSIESAPLFGDRLQYPPINNLPGSPASY